MNYDVIIIGGGIIGASILNRLTASGIDNCLLVDKGLVGGETTGASAGMVRVFHSDPLLAQMSAETMRTLTTLSEIDYQRSGAISILTQKHLPYAEKLRGYLKSAKYRAEILDAKDVASKFPALQFGSEEFVFYEPDAGSLDPRKMAKALAQMSQIRGAEVLESQGEAELILDRTQVVGVRTSKSEWRAKVVVNAAGPWAENLCRSVGAPLGTKLKAIQANYFEWKEAPMFPCIFDYQNLSYASCRRHPETSSGHALIGLALTEARKDLGGAAPFSKADLERAVKCLSHRLPDLKNARWLESRRWFDAYSLPKRGNLGMVPGYQGLMAAYGWGGTGVKLSQGIAARATSLLREQLSRGRVCETKTFLS